MKKFAILLLLISVIAYSSEKPVNVYLFRGPSAISMVKMIDENTSFSKTRSVNYNIVNSPDIMLSRIISGEADIAALPVNLAAKLYFKGLDYKIAVVSGYGLLYLLSSDPDIKSFKDINNKEIYNSGRGSSPEFILDYIIKETGLRPESVSYKYKHIELAQAIINNMVQTAVLPEPFVSKVLLANKNVKIISDIQEEWTLIDSANKYPMTCFVVKNSFALNNKNDLEKYFSIFNESIKWIKKNKKNTAKLVAENNLGFSYEESIMAHKRLNFCFITGFEMEKMLNDFYEKMLKHSTRLIGSRLPDSALYYKFD